jgi:glyoxylase-like metal-dependent hydrolase (beta-lactamase superfamily II)
MRNATAPAAVTRWIPAAAICREHEAMSLDFDVFLVDPKPIPSAIPGFEQATWPPSTSTLIRADDGALLIDCLITEDEGRQLAAWVKSRDADPGFVYITHPHADHFLGLPAILAAFPHIRPVALADSIPAMAEQVSAAYLDIWGGFFPGQLTSKPVVPAALPGTTVPIGGAAATLIPVGTTDTGHSSVVHVPGLNLVVSGDVVYNQTHMWLMGSTPGSRASWARALDAVAALGADTVVAGHRSPHAPDDNAERQISDCRRYLADFEAALAASTTPAELIDRMMTAHPDLANPYTLWVAAYDLLGPAT